MRPSHLPTPNISRGHFNLPLFDVPVELDDVVLLAASPRGNHLLPPDRVSRRIGLESDGISRLPAPAPGPRGDGEIRLARIGVGRAEVAVDATGADISLIGPGAGEVLAISEGDGPFVVDRALVVL